MMLQLNSALQDRLRRWANEGYPHGVAQVEDVTQARNLNTERAEDRYEMDPLDLLRADEMARARRLDIVGVWHTHPDHPARPSATDRAQAWDGWSYLILEVGAGGVQAMRSWRLEGAEFVEEAVAP